MTVDQWQASTDPTQMISWLGRQGYDDPLWDFTIASCRRVWEHLPGESFRRVVAHFERFGMRGIDGVLVEASQAVEQLEQRLRKTRENSEQAKLNREIGFGRMVFAFHYQVASDAARSISSDLIEWAEEPEQERQTQADLLRQLVPDASQRAPREEDDE